MNKYVKLMHSLIQLIYSVTICISESLIILILIFLSLISNI